MSENSPDCVKYKGPKDPEFVGELGKVVDQLFNLEGYNTAGLRKLIVKQKRRREAVGRLINQSAIEKKKQNSEGMTPRKYGGYLIHLAFNDASFIYEQADRSIPDDVEASDRSKILKSNSVELLRIAGLSDGDRGIIVGKIMEQEHPLTAAGQAPETRLEWIEDIQVMLGDRARYYKSNSKDAGCPAITLPVETLSGRDSLIHNFWDRFVDTMLLLPHDPQASFVQPQPANVRVNKWPDIY